MRFFLLAFVFIGLFPSLSQAGGGGGGVRGGGGVQCSSEALQTLESYEFTHEMGMTAQAPSEILIPRFLELIAEIDPALSKEIEFRLTQFGSIDTWPVYMNRPSALSVLQTSSSRDVSSSELKDWISNLISDRDSTQLSDRRAPRAWDEQILYRLPPSCRFRQLSILEAGAPKILPGVLDSLTLFDRRVLELHEALYSIFLEKYQISNPLLVRKLIVRSLIEIQTAPSSSMEIGKILNFAIHFQENKRSFLRQFPAYASGTLTRGVNVRGLTDPLYNMKDADAGGWVSVNENRYCPIALTFDYDGERGLLISSYFLRSEADQSHSILKKVSANLRDDHGSDSISTVKKIGPLRYLVTSMGDKGVLIDSVYEFGKHSVVASILSPEQIGEHRPAHLGAHRANRYFRAGRVRCEYGNERTKGLSSLDGARLFGELE